MPRRNRTQAILKFLQPPQKCGHKRRYTSPQEAEHVREEQELLNPGLELRVYKCVADCGGWHLTRHSDVL